MRSLMRGRLLQRWTMHLYTSRAKMLEHATELQRRPIANSTTTTSREKTIERVMAIVTDMPPMEIYTDVAAALPTPIPVIYFGHDPTHLCTIHTHIDVLPHGACRNVVEVMAVLCGLVDKYDRSAVGLADPSQLSLACRQPLRSGGSGLFGDRILSSNWDRFELPYQTDETREERRSRPTSPETRERRVREIKERHQREEREEEQAAEVNAHSVNDNRDQENIPANLPPAAHAALVSGKRVGLADAGPMLRTHTDLPSSRSPRTAPSSSSSSVDTRHVRFDDGRHSSAAAAVSITTQIPNPTPSTANQGQKGNSTHLPLTSRNPFGTRDALPPGLDERGMPIASTTRVPHTAPMTKQIQLTNERPEDRERLEAIRVLAERLHGYDLPAHAGAYTTNPSPPSNAIFVPPHSSHAILPGETHLARRRELECMYAHLPRVTRDLLVEDGLKRVAAKLRHLNRREDALLTRKSNLDSHRKAWSQTHPHNLHALSEKRHPDGIRTVVDIEDRIGRYLEEKLWREEQLEAERNILEEQKKQAVLDRIEAFNQAQSTARAVALAKIPDAPTLTNLQAVFLSPRSRKEVGANTPLNGDAAHSEPHDVALLSPRARLASRHLPSRSAIESAIRADYERIEAERRAEERRTLEIEMTIQAKARRIRIEQAIERQRRKEQARINKAERQKRKQEKQELRQMLKYAFDSSSSDDDDVDVDGSLLDDSLELFDLDSVGGVGVGANAHPHRAEQDSHSAFRPDAAADDDGDDDLRRIERLVDSTTYITIDDNNNPTQQGQLTMGATEVAPEQQAQSQQQHEPRRRDKRSSSIQSTSVSVSLHTPGMARRVALFDALSPELSHSHSHVAEVAAAAEVASRRIARAADEAQQESEKQSERRAEWSKAHPPMPIDRLDRRWNQTRIERRNPHEWHEEHKIVYGTQNNADTDLGR